MWTCLLIWAIITAFSSYGAFWMSYATILIPNSGILAAYDAEPESLADALSIFLFTWMIVTSMFLYVVFSVLNSH